MNLGSEGGVLSAMGGVFSGHVSSASGYEVKPQCDISIDNFVNFKSTGIDKGVNPTWGK